MIDYPNLTQFLEKHRLAQTNKAKDVRFSMEELNSTVHDIHKLMSSVSTKQEDHAELKLLLKSLLHELKELQDSAEEGAKF